MRRPAFTLVEVLIALALASILVPIAVSLMLGGVKMFGSGRAAMAGTEAALVVLQAFEKDLIQALAVPGDPRPPVRVIDGRRIEFLRPVLGARILDGIRGVKGSWDLTPAADGLMHPVRDGRILRHVKIEGWQLAVHSPAEAPHRPGWMVSVVVHTPTGWALRRSYRSSRLIQLAQPSAAARWFPTHGARLPRGLVEVGGAP